MRYLLDGLYLLAVFLLSPWLLVRALRTGKYQSRLWERFLGQTPILKPSNQPRLWLHGVSVGEIHLMRQLIAALNQRHPNWEIVVSTTTDTGFEEARKNFPNLNVFSFPFDFSWAVASAITRINPGGIVLAECELWPNFLLTARRLGVPVMVANGRMSPRSAARYERLKRLARPLLDCLDLIAVQTEEYAAVFRSLGVPVGRVHVTGSVKYDGVQSDRQQPKTQELRRLFGLRDELIWVCGSTQPPEEEAALTIYRDLRADFPTLRLILVPRQRERFDEVAALLERLQQPFVRRSRLRSSLSDRAAVILVDTIGELSAVWGLADVAFVGGSLDGKRGGQNMLEPAAYGAAVLFGPCVWNFAEPARLLTQARAAVQAADVAELGRQVRRLLGDSVERHRLGEAARLLVRSQQGATAHTVALIETLLHARGVHRRAA